MKKQPLTVKVASWSALHPGRAILGWFAFVALCLVIGGAVGAVDAADKDYWVGEAGRAESIATEGNLQHKSAERIMITDKSGAASGARAQSAAADVAARMKQLPEVEKVAAPVRSANGRMLMVEVTLKGLRLEAQKHIQPLLDQTAEVQKKNPDLKVEESGDASVEMGLDKSRDDDLSTSETITFPITLITLLVVFGSLIMVGVPLLLAVSSIGAAMGLSQLISHLVPDAGVGKSVILLIGMAVGVDYTLFYLKREREERAQAKGRLSPEALVGIAAATSGRAIVVSGLAVALSTATLFLATDIVFTSLAVATMVVVLVAVLSSMTALPALLVLIGRRLDRKAAKAAAGGKRVKWVRRHKSEKTGRIWTALLRPARNRPVATLLISVLVMFGLAVPAFGMHLRVLNLATHSRAIPELKTYDRLNEAFPDLLAEHWVMVRDNNPGERTEVQSALKDLAAKAQTDPVFSKKPPKLETTPDGRISVMTLSVPFNLSSPQAHDSLTELRKNFLPKTLGKVKGAEFAVSGPVAQDTDYLAHQNDKLPVVVGFLLLLTFVLTLFVFGSATIAALGVLLNLLSVGASFGLVVVFFQWGLASTVFGFEPGATHAIGSRVPLFLFVILFGLSMDYQVFVVSRIKEAALKGVPTRQAVIDGIGHSAKVVTSAAVVMVTVFASFMFLHLAEMKQIGFSLAVAVLLDAFIIRVMILPAALILLGNATWWPSHKMRRAQAQGAAAEHHDLPVTGPVAHLRR
ncbi:MMPL family transporter [Streptomyces violascens]|uniref:Membrane protein n=1 Tax=Streptomyces violascens TaxID=67381 RepID=A0ABQ3QLE0_9ACTN|nr:MMPL family transporter [Streptomyces violascens]GGU09256.1 membrane protein [Streptomyces violascens]GHI38093.1 membrane protein [Streptomyces violascens]